MIFDKRIISWFVFYTINHGLIALIPNALYWDDWYLYKMPPEIILNRFDQINSPFNVIGLLHTTMLQYGPILYKYLAFSLLFISGLLLDKINIRTLSAIGYSKQSAYSISYVIVLLFLVLPFNMARPLLIIFPSILVYFIFFLAWRMLDRHRILAAGLFFFSFEVNSMLVFYFVPLADLYLRTVGKISVQRTTLFAKRNWLFIILPFLYFAIKTIWFKPYGLYENYNNDFEVIKLLKSSMLQFANVFDVQINLGILILAFLINGLLLSKKTYIFTADVKCSTRWYLVGLFVFVAACFPYWMLGRVPTFNLWSSRHQLLIPLSIAIILTTIVIRKGNGLHQKAILIIFVSLSMAYNLNAYISYYVDWNKQVQLIRLLSKDQKIKDGSLIIFSDESLEKNYLNRNYAIYEWNGLLERAFSDQKRLGINVSDVERYLKGGLDWYVSSQFKAGDFDAKKDKVAVLVKIYDTRKDSRELGFKLDRSEKFLDQLFGWAYPKFAIKTECSFRDPILGYRNAGQCN